MTMRVPLRSCMNQDRKLKVPMSTNTLEYSQNQSFPTTPSCSDYLKPAIDLSPCKTMHFTDLLQMKVVPLPHLSIPDSTVMDENIENVEKQIAEARLKYQETIRSLNKKKKTLLFHRDQLENIFCEQMSSSEFSEEDQKEDDQSQEIELKAYEDDDQSDDQTTSDDEDDLICGPFHLITRRASLDGTWIPQKESNSPCWIKNNGWRMKWKPEVEKMVVQDRKGFSTCYHPGRLKKSNIGSWFHMSGTLIKCIHCRFLSTNNVKSFWKSMLKSKKKPKLKRVQTFQYIKNTNTNKRQHKRMPSLPHMLNWVGV